MTSGHVPSEPTGSQGPQQALAVCKLSWASNGYMDCKETRRRPIEYDDPALVIEPTHVGFGVSGVLPPCLYGGLLSTLCLGSPSGILVDPGFLQREKLGSSHDIALSGTCDVDAQIRGRGSAIPSSHPVCGSKYNNPAAKFCVQRTGAYCTLFHEFCRRRLIWDAPLRRSAEVLHIFMQLLQRQTLLLVACGFTNVGVEQLCFLDRHVFNGKPNPPIPCFSTELSGCQYKTCSWLCDSLGHFQRHLELMLGQLLLWIWLLVKDSGRWWPQAFAWLALTGCLHMCQLMLFALRLKGGQCNADNLLRCSRTICGGCPLGTAIVLMKCSPRLSSMKQPRKIGFSDELWPLLIILGALHPGVNAGAGSRHNVDSTGFRARRRSSKLTSAVYNIRSACRNLDSPDTPDEHPDGQPPDDPSPDGEDDWDFATDSNLLQFFSFGCLPSYMVCAFMAGTSLQEAIDQISVDAIVPVHDESGVFIPAKGVPLRDAVTLLWMLDWLSTSRNYLLFVDASMLGKYSFVIQYHGFAFSYADIAEQLRPLWEEELDHIYVFVPFFSLEPTQAHTRYPASNGLTVVLQRDVLAPACIPDPTEAFGLYKLWGLDVENVDQPPADLPWPVEKIQLSIDDETAVYSIGSLEPMLPVVWGLANRFLQGVDERQVQLARFLPDRHVWYGEPVSQLSAVSSILHPPGTICIFLVTRGIGRESRAAWTQQ